MVCRLACKSVISASSAKMAKPIEMLFGLWTRVGPKNHLLDGGPDPPCKGAILREGKGQPIVEYTVYSLYYCSYHYMHYYCQWVRIRQPCDDEHYSGCLIAILNQQPESPARGLRSSPPACMASLTVGSSKAP